MKYFSILMLCLGLLMPMPVLAQCQSGNCGPGGGGLMQPIPYGGWGPSTPQQEMFGGGRPQYQPHPMPYEHSNVCPNCGKVHGGRGGSSMGIVFDEIQDYSADDRAQVVQIDVPCSSHVNKGSGVIIGRDSNTSYVCTVAHNFDGWNQKTPTVMVQGSPYPATVIDIQKSADLALVSIKNCNVPVAPVAQSVPTTSVIHGFGYSRRSARKQRRIYGKMVRTFKRSGADWMAIGHGAPQGYSGGPFLSQSGQVVGIISMTDSRQAYGPTCMAIRKYYGQYIVQFNYNLPPAPFVVEVPDLPTPDPDTIGPEPEPSSDCPCGSPQNCIIIERLDALETKVNDMHLVPIERIDTLELRMDELSDAVLDLEDRIDDLVVPEPTPVDTNKITEEVYKRVSIDLKALEQDITIKLTSIENKIGDGSPAPEIDYDLIINAVVEKLEGNVGNTDASPARLLYFTIDGLERCDKTDVLAEELWETGYPINIITLKPTDTSITDVPRLFNTRTEEEIRGNSNITTYFSSLTF
jgi:hypothetical protein